MRVNLLLTGVILLASASAAHAQFTQYAAPGSLAVGEKSTRERLEEAMKQARWNFGPLRLEPWVELGNLTYHDDLEPWREGKQSDVTVSAGAGATAFLPLGHRILLAGYALPEYSWWRERSARRRLNGRYGAAAFTDLGRLSLDFKGYWASQPWYIGFENEVPIDVRRQGASLGAELRILRRLFVYGTAEETRWRYRDEDLQGAPLPRLRSLDRDERAASGGLRYRLQDRLSLSLGVRRSETDFLLPDFDRSNSGSAPTVSLAYAGGRLKLFAEVSRYDLKPRAGSTFEPFEGHTGSARGEWKLGVHSGVSLYSRESLAFSFGGVDYYTVKMNGAAVNFPLGWRGHASVFGERGEHTFSGGSQAGQDVRAYGARVNITVWRRSSLALGWERLDWDELDGRNLRSYDRFTASLNFGSGSAVTW